MRKLVRQYIADPSLTNAGKINDHDTKYPFSRSRLKGLEEESAFKDATEQLFDFENRWFDKTLPRPSWELQ